MTNLKAIINKYGRPKAIIDYATKPKKIIFGFDEVMYMNLDHNIFLNNKKISGDCLNIWQTTIEKWKNSTINNDIAALGFFSYDFKNILYPNYKFNHQENESTPYFWFGKPNKIIELDNYHYDYNNQSINFKNRLQDIDNFEQAIKQIKTYLYNGDVYQINYTQPITFSYNQNPLDLYMQIKERAKPKYGFYLDIDYSQFLSFTPEKFLIKTNDKIESYPIKGTIKRFDDKRKDLEQIERLSESEKDRAEHLMIVDLLRNDIGKISEFGSVNVENLFGIKTFETIHHMESKITGIGSENITEIEVIKALFPGGSITGAPKYRAIQIIDELENYNRGLYTGCLGTIHNNGDMDFNMCIRTITINNNIATYPVGGGIVWDSTVENEYIEAKEKANILNY